MSNWFIVCETEDCNGLHVHSDGIYIKGIYIKYEDFKTENMQVECNEKMKVREPNGKSYYEIYIAGPKNGQVIRRLEVVK